MAKFLLWVCIGVGGTIGSLLPMTWGSSDFGIATLFSTIGGLIGIWFWFTFLRYS